MHDALNANNLKTNSQKQFQKIVLKTRKNCIEKSLGAGGGLLTPPGGGPSELPHARPL